MFFYHDYFPPKILSYIDAVQNRKGRVVSVKTVVFSGNVQACLQRLQGIPGLSHWRPFCFSSWWYDNLYVRCIYMIILNSCSLTCLKKVHFFTLTCVFYWTQTPIFTVTRKIDNTCVINMLFDSDNTLTNKVISNLWVLLSSPNYLRLPLILLPYRCWFNGRFLTWCCCVKTNRIFRGWTKDYLCGVSKFLISSTNDIINYVHIFHENTSSTSYMHSSGMLRTHQNMKNSLSHCLHLIDRP